jgi:ABC-2 type transport system permease protein
MTLVFKQIHSFATLISWIILYLNGSIASLDKFPYWLQTIAHWLPTTEGIRALQQLTLGQTTLKQLWATGSLPFLIGHSALLLSIGTALFYWSERKAKRDGALGHY